MSENQSGEEEVIIVKEISIKKLFEEGVEFQTGADNILIIEREPFKQSY